MSPPARQVPARALAFPALTLATWIAGVALWGGAADPDRHFSLAQLSGTFLIFAAWALCVLGWGRFWCAILQLEKYGPWSMSIALGAAFASCSGMLLGHAGLIGYGYFPLLFCLMLAGPVACALRSVRLPIAWNLREWLAFAVLGVLLVSWLADASFANWNTDPLFYHLLGPRQWVDAGRIEMRFGMPSTFHCNYWEYILIWGMSLLGAPEGHGLIEGQLFGQWLHFVFGSVGCAVVVGALLERLSIRKIWIPAAIAAGFAAPVFGGYATLAKNDMGVAMWCLAGALILSHFPTRLLDLACAGFLLGLGMFGKIPTAISVAGLVVAWALIADRSDFKRWLKQTACVGIGILAPAVPIALRNWSFTGNPAFPFFDPFFHSGLIGIADTVASAGMMGKFASPLGWLRNIDLALGGTGFAWPFFFALPLAPAARRNPKVAWLLGGACLFALGAFALKTYDPIFVPMGFQRWIGACLFLVPCLGAAVMGDFMGDFVDWAMARLKLKNSRLPTLVSLVWVAVFSSLAWKGDAFQRLWDISPDVAIRRNDVHIGGSARAWLRLNATHGEKIATTGDQLFYYVAGLPIYSAVHYPPLESALDGVTRGPEAIRILRAFGIKYVVDIAHWESRYYGPFAVLFDGFVEQSHPEAIVYSDPQSLIVDLERLSDEEALSCVAADGTTEDQFLRLFEFRHPSSFTFRVCNPWQFSLDDPRFRLAS